MGLFAEGWNIAYRNKPTGTILSNDNTEFTVIKNSWRTWCADPFVFEHKGDVYIFAEVFDYFRNIAGIGYSVLNRKTGKFSKWRLVVKESFHMSYPFIFEKGDNIYMIPETSENKSLSVYKATHFPDKWEKQGDILNNRSIVDTTIDKPTDDVSLGLTYKINEQDKWELLLFMLSNGSVIWSDINPISTDDAVARPGGYFFEYKNKKIRVSQDCLESYGYALNFFEVSKMSIDRFSEVLLKKVCPDDINLDKKIRINGVHTYTSSENFEVIDVKSYMHNFVYVLLRFLRKIKRIIKRG